MKITERNGCVGVFVKDLIAYLQTQPPDAEMLIHDEDTGYYLPLLIGHDKYKRPPLPELLLPEGAVIVHGIYAEALEGIG